MAFRWRANDGPTLNPELVALCFSGSGPELLRNLYFCDYPEEASGPLVPPPPPRAGSAYVQC